MKCLFDNNMSPKLAKTLNYMEGDDGISVVHLKDKFPPDMPDVEWIEKLAEEGDWFVVTKDYQIRKRLHERKAWKESHLPIVFFPKAWIKHSLWEMAWRFIKCWTEVKENIARNRKKKSFQITANGKVEIIE